MEEKIIWGVVRERALRSVGSREGKGALISEPWQASYIASCSWVRKASGKLESDGSREERRELELERAKR